MRTYHVVPGNWNFAALDRQIKLGGGKAALKTVQGNTLTVTKNGDHNLMVTDGKGDSANVTITNVNQSNGVIHVIDHVLMP